EDRDHHRAPERGAVPVRQRFGAAGARALAGVLREQPRHRPGDGPARREGRRALGARGVKRPACYRWPAEDAMDRTLIAGTTILVGTGADPFPGDVLGEGPRVLAAQRGGGLPGGGARVVGGAGAAMMPGLA